MATSSIEKNLMADGILNEYANPTLKQYEKEAWNTAAIEKYLNLNKESTNNENGVFE
ncbi:MAG: hypothetical protein IJV15_04890 [Lachnospiraceae bacterium]|nr:hypothetical protein [Lachnospiraceae bacterium]